LGGGAAPRKGKGNEEGKGMGEDGREVKKGEGREMGKRRRGGKGVCPSNFYHCPLFLIPGVAPVKCLARSIYYIDLSTII